MISELMSWSTFSIFLFRSDAPEWIKTSAAWIQLEIIFRLTVLVQYFLLCSKYHTSDTVSYLLIIFEGCTSLIGMKCKYEFMCFSSFAAEKSLAFPSFTPSFCDHHNMPLLQGASLLSRRLQVFGWKKEWVHERETREERGSISAREASENGFLPPVQLPESHCVIFKKFWQGMIDTCTNKGFYINIFGLNISVIKIS